MLCRGFLRRKNNRDTIYFIADASNTDEKTTNDNILRDVEPKKVKSMVRAQRNEEPTAGNRLREV